jgi:hypothetical protein
MLLSLQALLATRDQLKAAPSDPGDGSQTQRRSSSQPVTAEKEPRQLKHTSFRQRDITAAAGRESGPGRAAAALLQRHKADGATSPRSLSRRVSFCDEAAALRATVGGERFRSTSASGKARTPAARVVLSNDTSEDSEAYSLALGHNLPRTETSEPGFAARHREAMSKVRAGLRACRNLYDMAGHKSAGSMGGTESDMVSTCVSDDSTEPSSSTRLGQRWLRYKLKEQRSAGGSGGGYESADELCSSGGGHTESIDDANVEPSGLLISRLRKSSLGDELSYSGAKTARVSSKLYTAPVSGAHAR